MIKKIIRKLNGNLFTRECIMIPIIYVRDKCRDLKNIGFINQGRKRLLQYKGIYAGKRCFIIGNGPSLVPEDLDLISGEVCFAANRIYDIYPMTRWRPTYYGIQDLYVLKEITQEVEDEEKGSKVRFIVSNRPQYMCEKMKIDPQNEFFYLGTCLSENREIMFSEDFAHKVGHGGTITYAMIQLAIYMGFTEIYLLGVDHSYGNYFKDNGDFDKDAHVKNHFAGSRAYKNLRVSNVPHRRGFVYVQTKAYEKAAEYARSHDITICNCTRGGKLEAFPRKSLEEVLDEG